MKTLLSLLLSGVVASMIMGSLKASAVPQQAELLATKTTAARSFKASGLGLWPGKYIFLDADSLEAQVMFVEQGKISWQASPKQLNRGYYIDEGTPDLPSNTKFQIDWDNGAHELKRGNLAPLGETLPPGHYLYSGHFPISETNYRTISGFLVSLGTLRWDHPFLPSGRYIHTDSNFRSNKNVSFTIESVSKGRYKLAQGGKELDLEIDDQGNTKWIGQKP